MSSTLGCAQNSNGTLRDASEIQFYRDVDEPTHACGLHLCLFVNANQRRPTLFRAKPPVLKSGYRNQHISAADIAGNHLDALIIELTGHGYGLDDLDESEDDDQDLNND
ncbi:hypothetical protein B0H13DRAFT_2300657 [Mycena leptocephala]|nr:hypothetical protein B0H13DRAFT_2300657 [Mycena leptocephala]